MKFTFGSHIQEVWSEEQTQNQVIHNSNRLCQTLC